MRNERLFGNTPSIRVVSVISSFNSNHFKLVVRLLHILMRYTMRAGWKSDVIIANRKVV
jgi:hypothetical protein